MSVKCYYSLTGQLCDPLEYSISLSIVRKKGYSEGSAFILKAVPSFSSTCCHSLRTPLNTAQSAFVIQIIELHGFGGYINHFLNGIVNAKRKLFI